MVWFIMIFALAWIFLITFLNYNNKVRVLSDKIEHEKSNVRIIKAKYYQVLKKVAMLQKSSLDSQSAAYKSAVTNGVGNAIGGAVGKIDDSLQSSSELITQLAGDYAKAQNELNQIINHYNAQIIVFPKSIYAAILGYKREQYIDEENINKSMLINGLDDDI